eukprot:2831967-Lingulodinium_polyedra.AAC.1
MKNHGFKATVVNDCTAQRAGAALVLATFFLAAGPRPRSEQRTLAAAPGRPARESAHALAHGQGSS